MILTEQLCVVYPKQKYTNYWLYMRYITRYLCHYKGQYMYMSLLCHTRIGNMVQCYTHRVHFKQTILKNKNF